MKKKKSGFIIKVVLGLFAAYAVVNLITIQFDIREKQSELDKLESEIQSVTLKNQQLTETMKTELTDDEIADIAREKLGFSLPGERIFVDITGK